MVRMCPDCGCVNSHHVNCPSYNEADFISEDEDTAYDEWLEEQAKLEDIDDVD